jgi:hypothetical protein
MLQSFVMTQSQFSNVARFEQANTKATRDRINLYRPIDDFLIECRKVDLSCYSYCRDAIRGKILAAWDADNPLRPGFTSSEFDTQVKSREELETHFGGMIQNELASE